MIPPNEGTANPNAIRLQSGQRTHLGPVRSSTPQPPRLGLQSLHSGRSPSIASPTNQYSPYGYTQNPSQSPVSPSHIMNIGHRQWEGSPSPPLMHAPISLNYGPPPSPPQSPGSRRAPLTNPNSLPIASSAEVVDARFPSTRAPRGSIIPDTGSIIERGVTQFRLREKRWGSRKTTTDTGMRFRRCVDCLKTH
ncbi:hypothetical protein Moror_4099 [Moniliophthora roreri MCA 2997]|uniref:Uncharacterized protein n=1 Tax=Moniliophthora roreri (strain MCA 2997) TaxID=1381753 RepID=V2XD44_MONRO|nr:hypothetical protein Moror_4099 [Moniliophthora roreri MCA 2997]